MEVQISAHKLFAMSTSPLLSATVLGKRKAVTSLVLHLASSPEPSHPQSDSDFEPEVQAKALPPIIVNGKLVENTKKRYRCTYQGCSKAYTKPSRLEEHERSHTGEVCYHIVNLNRRLIRLS
jgi:hypothetical protein